MHRAIDYGGTSGEDLFVKSMRSISKDGKTTERFDGEFTPLPREEVHRSWGLLGGTAYWLLGGGLLVLIVALARRRWSARPAKA